jgi:NitT/TauT family transport system substrate-binding protein
MAALACSRTRGPLKKLRILVPRRLTLSSFYLAYERGYFRDAGLDLEIAPGLSSTMALTQLTHGSSDAYFGSFGISLLNAVIKGSAVRIVAGREILVPHCGAQGAIIGLRRKFPKGLDNLSQLKGKRIGTGPTIGLAQFALDSHLARAGLSIRDVVPVRVEFQQSMAALLGGSVDAVVGPDDADRILTSMSSEIVQSVPLSGLYPNLQYSYIYFGNSLMQGDTAPGARFIAAYLHGTRDFVGGQTPQFMREFIKAGNLDEKTGLGMCRNTFSLDGAIDLNSLRLFIDWAERRNFIPRHMEPSELVDFRFLGKDHAH